MNRILADGLKYFCNFSSDSMITQKLENFQFTKILRLQNALRMLLETCTEQYAMAFYLSKELSEIYFETNIRIFQ